MVSQSFNLILSKRESGLLWSQILVDDICDNKGVRLSLRRGIESLVKCYIRDNLVGNPRYDTLSPLHINGSKSEDELTLAPTCILGSKFETDELEGTKLSPECIGDCRVGLAEVFSDGKEGKEE